MAKVSFRMVSASRKSVFGVPTTTARKNHRSGDTEGQLSTKPSRCSVRKGTPTARSLPPYVADSPPYVKRRRRHDQMSSVRPLISTTGVPTILSSLGVVSLWRFPSWSAYSSGSSMRSNARRRICNRCSLVQNGPTCHQISKTTTAAPKMIAAARPDVMRRGSELVGHGSRLPTVVRRSRGGR